MKSMQTFAEKVIEFNSKIIYTGDPLPAGIRIMNPFKEHEQTLQIADKFY